MDININIFNKIIVKGIQLYNLNNTISWYRRTYHMNSIMALHSQVNWYFKFILNKYIMPYKYITFRYQSHRERVRRGVCTDDTAT